jgi:hypothetical protein
MSPLSRRLTFPAPGLYFKSPMTRSPLRLLLVVLLVLAGVLGSPIARAQSTAPGGDFPMRTYFSVRSAQPDDTIPEALRQQFEKDDGGPLRSVSIDLDSDGVPEKFVLSGVPSLSGGYQWLIYDVRNGTGRGVIVGAIIFVGRETHGGWPRLETCWKQGGDMSVVSRYAFDKTRYGRTATKALTLWETSEYFRSKGPLDPASELVEIVK